MSPNVEQLFKSSVYTLFVCGFLVLGFLAQPASAVTNTLTSNTQSQLTLIQQLLEQVQQMQTKLNALNSSLSNSSNPTVGTSPSITILSPVDRQIVQASMVTQQITWEYEAIPGDEAGPVIVRERLFDNKNRTWGKWVTIAEYDSYMSVSSVPWQPSQPSTRTVGEVSVGIRNAQDTEWIAQDVVEIVFTPISQNKGVIKVLSPNGGNRKVVTDPIKVEFKSTQPYPALHYINLIDETEGKSYSLDSLLGSQGISFTEEQIKKGKQSISVTIPDTYDLNEQHKFKIEVCVENTCDKSNSPFRIYKPVTIDDVSFLNTKKEGFTSYHEFTYTINNWRKGIVVDVEPTVVCDDSNLLWGNIRNCKQFVFDLTQKAGETYYGKSGNPYVKAGALYRFTGGGTDEKIYIKSYPNPDYPYSSKDNEIMPYADIVKYRIILRDTTTGREIWSQEYIVNNVG